jgi:alpha-beta hydrolase superfamily lysophospholipase
MDYSGAFDEIGPDLAGAGFAVLAYDQRGFGATASSGHWTSRNRMVGDLVDAARFIRQGMASGLPLFLIGESMGGGIAIDAAARGVADVSGIVLAAPSSLACPLRYRIASWVARLLVRAAPSVELVFTRLSGWELTLGAALRLLFDPLILRGLRPHMFFGLIRLAAGEVNAASKVRTPVLTLMGARDDILLRNCVRTVHQKFMGQKEQQDFPDGPHMLLHWTHRKLVLKKIIYWLQERMRSATVVDQMVR